jgi:hypothetical protein
VRNQKLQKDRTIKSELGDEFECLLAREGDHWDFITVALSEK